MRRPTFKIFLGGEIFLFAAVAACGYGPPLSMGYDVCRKDLTGDAADFWKREEGLKKEEF